MNRGEDAHEATVTVTLPPYLAFTGSDEQVRYNNRAIELTTDVNQLLGFAVTWLL